MERADVESGDLVHKANTYRGVALPFSASGRGGMPVPCCMVEPRGSMRRWQWDDRKT